ncbi:Regenerating islet-derived protein 3-gamma [Galemys pyrenaicus]|uniref:Regenerating islet-derived protein 3-gamma n=1 Tax=Galemys pyrenaicus TaxID=202257 RepID=A0A8J6AI10_GALPY|nr:Regenerating islet-derived protein 3-gamma [Galemys pyrenaicus]
MRCIASRCLHPLGQQLQALWQQDSLLLPLPESSPYMHIRPRCTHAAAPQGTPQLPTIVPAPTHSHHLCCQGVKAAGDAQTPMAPMPSIFLHPADSCEDTDPTRWTHLLALVLHKEPPFRDQLPPGVMDRVVRSVSLRSVSCTLLSCLMLVAQAQGAVLKNAQSSPRNGCPSGSMAYASHCYALFQTTKSWMDANMDCQRQESGHLVSVLSGSEASFVAALIRNSGISQSYVWIGLHDPTEGSRPNAGGWEWSNSAILNYRAWERNPPTSPSSGYCGSVSRTSSKNWDQPLPDPRFPLPPPLNLNLTLRLPHPSILRNGRIMTVKRISPMSASSRTRWNPSTECPACQCITDLEPT